MILVDTSVWSDHFRRSDLRLVRLLRGDEAGCHAMVIGELSLSSMPARTVRMSYLSNLYRFPSLHDDELLHLVETRRLWGRGLSLVDVNLIGSVLVVPGACLWTRDKRLRAVAKELEIAFE